ncbi:MAG: hypothetical protein ACW97A_03290 [Candidatus Thorarchaeota archaeon]|jgi:hypothetical protein
MSPVGEKKEQLIFASTVFPTESSETDAILLAESIRAFSGSSSNCTIWYFFPNTNTPISSSARTIFDSLDATLIPFEIDKEVLQFPFTGNAHAAALAESMASGKTELLAWLAANTVIVQEPREFILQEDKDLGYRPVHHTLIGSRFEEPIDEFWKQVYIYCKVSEDSIFPMRTHVDDTLIRPYFNAGILIARPEKKMLQSWRDTFISVYQDPFLFELYKKDHRYAIFIHQAILSGVILSIFSAEEIQEFTPKYNYPVHLHDVDVTDQRPNTLDECVTFRHEGFYKDPDWADKMPANDSLKKWLAERLH